MANHGERYAQISENLIDHPKTTRLARSLRVNRLQILGHLTCLWNWALKNALDGDLSKIRYRDIADAARFTDYDDLSDEADVKADQFVKALLECSAREGGAGFLEVLDGRLVIHDWHQYGGKLLEARRKNAVKVQRHRGREKPSPDESITEEKPECNQDVTVTEELRDESLTVTLNKIRGDKNRVEEILPNGRTTRAQDVQPRGLYPPEAPLPLAVQEFISQHGGTESKRWEEELRLDLSGRELTGPPSAYMLGILRRWSREGLPRRGAPPHRDTPRARTEALRDHHAAKLAQELAELGFSATGAVQ